ncbi:hypothetical protein SK128_006131 [Halocaridina rubra]|uniref:Uncharacterized protein n=1 Tax=Halocaridina rubra TaxID=373956 RepID=A0AAN8XBJ6_HALRR
MTARHLNLVWMMSHTFETDILPMWVGFNAIFYKDQLSKQKRWHSPSSRKTHSRIRRTGLFTETGVLAPGSLNGFLTGKYFNRCKRLHPLLALAFERLHFRAFLETYDSREELHTLISTVKADPNTGEQGLELMIGTDLFEKCSKEYYEFTKATVLRAHGYTERF